MAKAKRFAPTPMVRSVVREVIRGNGTADQAVREATSRFANVNRTSLNRIVREEQKRQEAVKQITDADKRYKIDLGTVVGCRGKNAQVRARITLSWFDQTTGIQRTYGGTEILRKSGRLSTILNEAIGRIAQDAVGKGYTPPTITSAQTEGTTSYRIEYIECA